MTVNENICEMIDHFRGPIIFQCNYFSIVLCIFSAIDRSRRLRILFSYMGMGLIKMEFRECYAEYVVCKPFKRTD